MLRRILRRAVYFGSQFLGAKPGFFNKLVPSVVATYGDFFEEIKANEQVVINVLKEEEAQFNKTIDKGLKVFKKKAAELKKAGTTVVPGADCFFLRWAPCIYSHLQCLTARQMTDQPRHSF